MKLEHVALNVADPVAMAAWYQEHLELEIAMRVEGPPHTHFLRDSGGQMMLEIYANPPDQVPDYRGMNPLLLHIAFVCDDPAAVSQKLQNAGAAFVNDVQLADGSVPGHVAAILGAGDSVLPARCVAAEIGVWHPIEEDSAQMERRRFLQSAGAVVAAGTTALSLRANHRPNR